jgi:hypothetical protein
MYNFEKHCKFSQNFVSMRMLIFELIDRVEVNVVPSTTFFDGFVVFFKSINYMIILHTYLSLFYIHNTFKGNKNKNKIRI